MSEKATLLLSYGHYSTRCIDITTQKRCFSLINSATRYTPASPARPWPTRAQLRATTRQNKPSPSWQEQSGGARWLPERLRSRYEKSSCDSPLMRSRRIFPWCGTPNMVWLSHSVRLELLGPAGCWSFKCLCLTKASRLHVHAYANTEAGTYGRL